MHSGMKDVNPFQVSYTTMICVRRGVVVCLCGGRNWLLKLNHSEEFSV